MAKRIFLIRHGETAWSLSGQHTGLTDIPLLEQGRKQAQALAHRLKDRSFDHVFVSPLKRAVETCQIAGFYDQAIIEPDLLEWDYGKYEGLTSEQIHTKDPSWTIFEKGAPGGESTENVSERISRLFNKIEALSGNIALFSSGHLLRSLAARWLGFRLYEGIHFLLKPASISILGQEGGVPVISVWNDTSHLRDLAP